MIGVASLSPRVQVDPRGSRFQVSLDGELHLGWAEALTSELGRRRVNIHALDADLVDANTRRWVVRLTTDQHPGDDLVELLLRPLLRGRPAVIQRHPIIDYQVSRGARSLRLEVRAHDTVGFLGSLLRSLGMLSLFPIRIEATSRDGVIEDAFQLVGLGGGVPSPAAVRALEQILEDRTGR